MLSRGHKPLMSESEFVSINPASGNELARHPALSPAETQEKILCCHQAFLKWQKSSAQDRASALLAIATQLEEDREQLACLITQEMGKPLREQGLSSINVPGSAATSPQWGSSISMRTA